MISSLRCCVSGMNWFYVFLYDVTICNCTTGNGQGCSVRDEIFTASVRMVRYKRRRRQCRVSTMAIGVGKRHCRILIISALPELILIPLRGKVNCNWSCWRLDDRQLPVSIPLRGKVNCDCQRAIDFGFITPEFQSPCGEKWIATKNETGCASVRGSFNPLAGKSELRLMQNIQLILLHSSLM